MAGLLLKDKSTPLKPLSLKKEKEEAKVEIRNGVEGQEEAEDRLEMGLVRDAEVNNSRVKAKAEVEVGAKEAARVEETGRCRLTLRILLTKPRKSSIFPANQASH